MNAEIKYTLGRCHYVKKCNAWSCSDCDDYHKWAGDIEKGFSGEIREYSIHNEGMEAYIDIVINLKKKINLCIDMYGRNEEDSYPYQYDDCEYFMVDGKVLWGEKPGEVTNEDA